MKIFKPDSKCLISPNHLIISEDVSEQLLKEEKSNIIIFDSHTTILDPATINGESIDMLSIATKKNTTANFVTAQFLRRYRMMHNDSEHNRISFYIAPEDSTLSHIKDQFEVNKEILKKYKE